MSVLPRVTLTPAERELIEGPLFPGTLWAVTVEQTIESTYYVIAESKEEALNMGEEQFSDDVSLMDGETSSWAIKQKSLDEGDDVCLPDGRVVKWTEALQEYRPAPIHQEIQQDTLLVVES